MQCKAHISKATRQIPLRGINGSLKGSFSARATLTAYRAVTPTQTSHRIPYPKLHLVIEVLLKIHIFHQEVFVDLIIYHLLQTMIHFMYESCNRPSKLPMQPNCCIMSPSTVPRSHAAFTSVLRHFIFCFYITLAPV